MPTFKKQNAIQFVVLLGFVSLFADITYEGARSITGQYLAVLGASGTVVGIVSGLGELIGYGFRYFSGLLSDRTQRYWLLTLIGYILNLVAVPLLALAGNWPVAAALMILERFGKAIRTPPRDAMLSFATKETGRGWGFGLHEALDQVGAILGPLVISAVLYFNGSYQTSFVILFIPALCALSVLAAAMYLYPRPQDLEGNLQKPAIKGFSHSFWLYMAAISLVAAGYVDFPLIAYHFEKAEAIPGPWIPVFFSIAMAADGLAALIVGRLYDKKGLKVLTVLIAICSLFAPLVFLDGFYTALLGMLLWGIGLGAQESTMRAVVGNLVEMQKRGTAYGTMNLCYGVFWFLGSAVVGILYDVSIPALILFSVGMQLIAIPCLMLIKKS